MLLSSATPEIVTVAYEAYIDPQHWRHPSFVLAAEKPVGQA